MPVQSRWMIKISLVYLAAGIISGALMLVHKAYPLFPGVWKLLPIHIEILIFGWIIQLTLGTAYWMLPRFLKGPPRGSTLRAWMMVFSLNAGIVVILLSHLGWLPDSWVLYGRLLEVFSVVLFISLHWKRILTYRKRNTSAQ